MLCDIHYDADNKEATKMRSSLTVATSEARLRKWQALSRR